MPRPALDAGEHAPNVKFRGEHDELVALSDLWTGAERGIVLGFLRHCG